MATKQRPSPTESATVFEIGTKRRGNDGNMYIVKTDKNGKYRWAKHAEETIVNKEIVEKAPKRKAQSKKNTAEPAKSEEKPKKKYTRKAPEEPAKKFEVGHTMEGLDGNTYIVKETKNGVMRWFLEQ